MIEQFQKAAEAVGAVVRRCKSLADAAAHIRTQATPPLAAFALPAALLQELGELQFVATEDCRNAASGISQAEAGIAATGSLLLDLSDPDDRGASALPPVHLVLLRASTIVADLPDLAGILAKRLAGAPGTYLSLTTGPSRTADIERVLTIGVHGPKELHILILEEDRT